MSEPSISPWVADSLRDHVMAMVNSREFPPELEAQNRLSMLSGMAEAEYADSLDPALSSVVEFGRAAVDLFVFCVPEDSKAVTAAADRLREVAQFHFALRDVS
ncbi:hypothetical protein [Nocardia sp. 852002-51244_SCH5132740]|uniref:hypothetical protein n=1 Tax=Nocardia sp. 852002-51244_SCH5132740 TaxID=1834099 RepID=UPI000AD93022|nr:hypothetical protein [Nocardia sp. 852002-51244_SCH5132740]